MFQGLITEPMPLIEREKAEIFNGVLDLEPAESLDEDYLTEKIKGRDALLVTYAKITRKTIEAGDKLKVIARYGAGTDNIDVEAATERGIPVTYCPEYHLPTVAEHALAHMFAIARQIPASAQSVKSGEWNYKQFRGVDIEGKTLGILGLGRIGATLAKKALGLDMKVIGYDAILTPEQVSVEGLRFASYDQVVKEADFLAICVPLTDETRGSINKQVFQQMKKTAFLVNTARGPIINEKDLHQALTSGEIAGASLDVMEKEPPGKSHPLYELDNVIITPHTAWYTEEAMVRLEMTSAQNAVDVLQGRKPKYIRNPEVLK